MSELKNAKFFVIQYKKQKATKLDVVPSQWVILSKTVDSAGTVFFPKKNWLKLRTNPDSQIRNFENGCLQYECKIKRFAQTFSEGEEIMTTMEGKFSVNCKFTTY